MQANAKYEAETLWKLLNWEMRVLVFMERTGRIFSVSWKVSIWTGLVTNEEKILYAIHRALLLVRTVSCRRDDKGGTDHGSGKYFEATSGSQALSGHGTSG